VKTVLAIDPGSSKCGLALVSLDRVLHKTIVSGESILSAITDLSAEYSIDVIVVGNGTGSSRLIDALKSAISIPIETVEEKFSTLKARRRFFEENPPRGLRRLIPRGLLTPDRPIDDYAAVIIAEDYLARKDFPSPACGRGSG